MKKKHKAAKHKPKPKPKPVAAPLVVYKANRPVILNRGQVDLIRRLCAKDADDDQFALFMQIAMKSKLDPFKKEIYCLIFTTDNGRSRDMVIVTGIGGYRTMAARDHKDYDGTSAGQYVMTEERTPAGKQIPESCTMKLYMRGSAHPSEQTVYWEEFAPKDLTAKRSDFWNRMPKHMLAKCCEGQLLRKRCPGLNNIFVDAELDRRRQDFTESGHRVTIDGVTPSGTIVSDEARKRLSPERQAMIDQFKEQGRWCEKHECLTMTCPVDEHTKAENDEAYAAERRHAEKKLEETKKAEDQKRDELRKAADEKESKKAAPAKPDDKTIDVTPEKPAAEIWPKGEKKPPKPKSMDGMQLVNGTLHNTIHSSTTNNHTPVLNCKIGNTWYKCFRSSIFEALSAHHAHAVEVFVDPKSHNLVGLRRIGQLEYENDGKTEKSLQVNREAGNGRK